MEKLSTLYQQFIFMSRYSRWIGSEGRRETWDETVTRYFTFFRRHLMENCQYELSDETIEELKSYIMDLKVMPSMRALATAGLALEKDNVAGYNCSYVPIEHQRIFSEILFILMNGVGVGFSVEKKYVEKLPKIPERLQVVVDIIHVGDSKKGWAVAFDTLINKLYEGKIPQLDLSRVRPEGSRLETFGGRSSGPQPLLELFHFAIDSFKKAQGRQFRPIEVHDLVCKVASIVVVGGVRRSALISLSDLDDKEMSSAKSGEWWKEHPQRALANNSVCYNSKPNVSSFLKEWISLYDSKSGERGIFNREATVHTIKKFGGSRRDPNHEFGCNPCVTADTWVQTVDGPQQVRDLIGKSCDVIVNGKAYPMESNGFFYTGNKPVYELKTSRGFSVKATANHMFLTSEGKWQPLEKITTGSTIFLSKHKGIEWVGKGGCFEEGYLLGQVVGDGGIYFYNKEQYPNHKPKAYVRFWKKDEGSFKLFNRCVEYINKVLKTRIDCKGGFNKIHDTWQIGSTSLYELCEKKGVNKDKYLNDEFMKNSSEFLKGFLQGMFDSDGCVTGFSNKKGLTVRLAQINLHNLQIIQMILHKFGIFSYLYENRSPERKTLLPNGKGGYSEYQCKPIHEIIISKHDNLKLFIELINFGNEVKRDKLFERFKSFKRKSITKEYDTIVSITNIGNMDVYDVTVSEVHEFCANGIRAHNCSEISLRPYQFCNLSEIIVRSHDTLETLKEKARVASILGTFQATLTNFGYISPQWRENCLNEALLGVSLTGLMDNPFMNGSQTYRDATGHDYSLSEVLDVLRQVVVSTNIKWSKVLNINPSTATTCVKPSGTVSQLVDSASGIHPRHSKFYIRTVRAAKMDPISKFMIDRGFPHEEDKFNKHSWVFAFPIASPEHTVTRDRLRAIDHLKLWKIYQENYCEHKPSITVSIREDEWFAVADFVYTHFDNISGVSFLPYSDHVYEQAPYQDINGEQYIELCKQMPKSVNWSELSQYETTDNTTTAQEFACVGNACEL